MSLELMEVFAAAFNRHDTDTLMGMMTEDCIFDTSAGDEVFGTRYEGQAAGVPLLQQLQSLWVGGISSGDDLSAEVRGMARLLGRNLLGSLQPPPDRLMPRVQ